MKNTSTFARIMSYTLVLTFIILTSSSPQSVYAEDENSTNLSYEEFSDLQQTELFEAFLEKINTLQNKNLSLDTAENYFIEDQIATIIFLNDEGGITAYQTPLNAESALPNGMVLFSAGAVELNGSNPSRFPLWPIIRTAISIIMKVRNGCQLIQQISGENVCSIIGKAMLDTLQPNVQYKATAYFHRDPNCVPPHSQQCNMAPYAYWETTVVLA